MKSCITLLLLSVAIQPSFAQQTDNSNKLASKLGISYSSFGENDVFRFEELEGAGSYLGTGFFTLGLNYVYPLSKRLELETGLEYGNYKFNFESNLPPDVAVEFRKYELPIFQIPVMIRANFLRFFYANAGLIVDFDPSNNEIDNQTGIGTILGLVVKYDLPVGASVYINPYTKIHSMLPFQQEQDHQRIWENGIRVGVTWRLAN